MMKKEKLLLGASSTYGDLLDLLKQYCSEENQKYILSHTEIKTNYKHIKILTDMDTDGNDILCLLLLFFSAYPQLFINSQISRVLTPLYIAKSRNKSKKTYYFYSEDEYLENIHLLDNTYEISYIKGLGSLSTDEYRETVFNNPKELVFNLSENSIKYLQIAFSDDRIARKQWLLGE